jgi:hypothetical protein
MEGIIFIEGDHPKAKPIEHIKVKIHGILSQAQLKNLKDIKRKMIEKVKDLNGNCITNFKYGQESKFWTTIIGIDNVAWYGSGVVSILPNEVVKELIKQKEKND